MNNWNLLQKTVVHVDHDDGFSHCFLSEPLYPSPSCFKGHLHPALDVITNFLHWHYLWSVVYLNHPEGVLHPMAQRSFLLIHPLAYVFIHSLTPNCLLPMITSFRDALLFCFSSIEIIPVTPLVDFSLYHFIHSTSVIISVIHQFPFYF